MLYLKLDLVMLTALLFTFCGNLFNQQYVSSYVPSPVVSDMIHELHVKSSVRYMTGNVPYI